jgi:hypothetical protein
MGAWLLTVTATAAGTKADRPRLSVTARVKVSTAGSEGAVKVGVTTSGLLSVTGGPPVCVQW